MNLIRSLSLILILICFVSINSIQAQVQTVVLIQTSHEDENIGLSIDKPIYLPGDTIHLRIQREKDSSSIALTPYLTIKETSFAVADSNTYLSTIPQDVIPGSYHVYLNVIDAEGRRFLYVTDCVVEIEEKHEIEDIKSYVLIEPNAGSEDPKTAVTLGQKEVQNLKIVFMRDKIPEQMGPQFLIIRTTIISREGVILQTNERRVMTFRSHGDLFSDRIAFNQYRTAYGTYAATRYDETEKVELHLDSLPDWSIIKVTIAPDYIIKIGTYNQSNSVTRFFQVKGPSIEIGLFLGFPKVLYDSQADDTLDYGNTSAILRFYYVDPVTGHRFPINIGIGTFGLNSPFNLAKGTGGFAISLFLDVANLLEQLSIFIPSKIKNVSLGIDLSPFVPIKKRWRFLINAYIGYAF